MAFNFDHTADGDISFRGAHTAFTGNFIFPLPTQSRESHVIMTSNAGFGIEAIYGMQAELDSKTNTGDVGSAIYLNADNTDLPVLVDDGNGNGVLADSTIPASILNSIFTTCTEFGLRNLTEAKKGDFATVITSSKTYVLTGIDKINDWISLRDEEAIITSVQGLSGSVCISGSMIEGCASDYIAGSASIELHLQCLQACKFDASCLDAKFTFQCLTDSINGYGGFVDTTDLSNCVMNNFGNTYLTCCSFYDPDCGWVATHHTSTCVNDTLLPLYVPKTEIENKAGWCTYTCSVAGPGQTQLLVLNSSNLIDNTYIPTTAITETYTVADESELAGLSAHPGDVAVSPSTVWVYDNSGDWQILTVASGILLYLNGQSPDGNGSVTIHTQDVYLNTTESPTSGTNDLVYSAYTKVGNVETLTPYQSESALASCLMVNYITTGAFYDLATGKSDVGHTHAICEITDFESEILNKKAFKLGPSYSVHTDPTIVTSGTSNVIFGESASENGLSYAVIHSAGKFVESGDAQVVQLKLAAASNNCAGSISFGDGLDLVSAEMVGYDGNGNNVSYRIEGLFQTVSGTTSVVGDTNVLTFAENMGGCASNALITTSSNSIQLCIDSTVTMSYLLADVNIVHTH